MNELLGWYGYDKLDTREAQGLNLRRFASSTSSNDPNHHQRSSHSHIQSETQLQQNAKQFKLIEAEDDDEESRSASSPITCVSEGGGSNHGFTMASSPLSDDNSRNINTTKGKQKCTKMNTRKHCNCKK